MIAKNLVVGFCTNMPVDRTAVLCRSVRNVFPASEAEILIITNDPAGYADGLRGLDVSFRLTPCDHTPSTSKVEKLFKRMAVHGGRMLRGGPLDRAVWGGACERFLPSMLEAWCHPLTARWHAYAAALKERPYLQNVLMTDTKDVVVQADCFSGLAGDRVQIFQEGFTIGEDRWNSEWIRSGFGGKALAAVKDVQATCMGTVLGTRSGALRFVEHLQSIFTRYPYKTIDQGTVNWLLHKEGDPPYLSRIPNLEGAIGTISSDAARAAVEFKDGMIVRRADGTVIPVVHMWDRWDDLREAVLERYRDQPTPAIAGSGR